MERPIGYQIPEVRLGQACNAPFIFDVRVNEAKQPDSLWVSIGQPGVRLNLGELPPNFKLDPGMEQLTEGWGAHFKITPDGKVAIGYDTQTGFPYTMNVASFESMVTSGAQGATSCEPNAMAVKPAFTDKVEVRGENTTMNLLTSFGTAIGIVCTIWAGAEVVKTIKYFSNRRKSEQAPSYSGGSERRDYEHVPGSKPINKKIVQVESTQERPDITFEFIKQNPDWILAQAARYGQEGKERAESSTSILDQRVGEKVMKVTEEDFEVDLFNHYANSHGIRMQIQNNRLDGKRIMYIDKVTGLSVPISKEQAHKITDVRSDQDLSEKEKQRRVDEILNK